MRFVPACVFGLGLCMSWAALAQDAQFGTRADMQPFGPVAGFTAMPETVCPEGTGVLAFHGLKSDTQRPMDVHDSMSEYRIRCTDGLARNSLPGIAAEGGILGFSGTASAQCPAGTLMVGLQGLK